MWETFMMQVPWSGLGQTKLAALNENSILAQCIEQSVTQTKIKEENGNLLNLSGGVARWASTEVKQVMEKVI